MRQVADEHATGHCAQDARAGRPYRGPSDFRSTDETDPRAWTGARHRPALDRRAGEPVRRCLGRSGHLPSPLNTTGFAQRAIDITIEYTRERKAFGRSILDNQAVHYRLTELQAEVEAVRALSWRIVEAWSPAKMRLAWRRWPSSRPAGRPARASGGCLQCWGGMGFMEESLPSRLYRDMRLPSIGGGFDEVMLQILSRFMRTFPQK